LLRVTAGLVLLAIGVVGYSLVASMHLHVTPEGRVIVHSHPFSESDDKGQGQHTHSDLDRIFLSQINKVFFSLLTLALLVLLGYVWLLSPEPSGRDLISQRDLCSQTLKRAPPLSLSL
jgi:hypothetical protein